MFNPYFILIALTACLASSGLAYYKGGVNKSNELHAQHNLDLLAQEKEYAQNLQRKQNEILEIEKEWLDEQAETQVIYKTKYKTIIKKVEADVKSNNFDRCRISDDSMRQVNQALRESTQPHDTK